MLGSVMHLTVKIDRQTINLDCLATAKNPQVRLHLKVNCRYTFALLFIC